ncbi:MAG: hypothetical protein WBN52_04465, partial [Eudoraea sp.]
MNNTPLESVPLYVIYIGLFVLQLMAFEIGYQITRRNKKFKEEVEPGTLSPMVGGLIGVLGFLLAFTFSIATSQ